MTHVITPEDLGRRLRAARETSALTQDDVANELGLSRSAIAQIELGHRGVSGIELAKLAFLFARDMREFVAAEYTEADPLGALFRSDEDVSADATVGRKLRECVALGRELTNIERILGFDRDVAVAATYPLPQPRSKWEAIEQGARIADEERRRLGLGNTPAPELLELLETQGVRTALVELPDDVSGLTLSDPRTGLFLVANESQHVYRRRFSFAHEYAHVLLDRARFGLVSRNSKRDDLVEVRANSFAACFLMPGDGVLHFLANIGKGKSSRAQLDVFDDDRGDVDSVEGRGDARAQALQLYDVIHLAHHFGVSAPSALYRLKNLKIIGQAELETLRAHIDERGTHVRRLLGLPEPSHEIERRAFKHRFLSLALEAYRRERISRSKLSELTRMMHVSAADLDQLLSETGLDSLDDADALLPDDGE